MPDRYDCTEGRESLETIHESMLRAYERALKTEKSIRNAAGDRTQRKAKFDFFKTRRYNITLEKDPAGGFYERKDKL